MNELGEILKEGGILLYSAISAVSAFVGWFIGKIKRKK